MKPSALICIGLFLCSFRQGNIHHPQKEHHLKGRVMSVAEYHYALPGDTGFSRSHMAIEQTFERDGNMMEKMYFSFGVAVDTECYTYDGKGRLLEKNSVSWRTVYTYNDKGQLTETNRYVRGNGNLMERMTYDYDSKGNEHEINSYQSSGKANCKMTVTITGKDDREEVSQNADGTVDKRSEVYDSNGDLSRSRLVMDANSKDPLTHAVRYVYEAFDSVGNWTRRREYEPSLGDDDYTTTVRTIKYYE